MEEELPKEPPDLIKENMATISDFTTSVGEGFVGENLRIATKVGGTWLDSTVKFEKAINKDGLEVYEAVAVTGGAAGMQGLTFAGLEAFVLRLSADVALKNPMAGLVMYVAGTGTALKLSDMAGDASQDKLTALIKEYPTVSKTIAGFFGIDTYRMTVEVDRAAKVHKVDYDGLIPDDIPLFSETAIRNYIVGSVSPDTPFSEDGAYAVSNAGK